MTKPLADRLADIPSATQQRVLRHLVEDAWTPQRTARHLQIPYDVAQTIVDAYGPAPQKLAIALEQLAHPAVPAPAAAVPSAPASVTVSASPAAPPDLDGTTLALAGTLAKGLGSSSARIRNRAEKIRNQLQDLAGRLAADEKDARRRAEVARLQAEKAALEAKIAALKGAPAPAGGTGPGSAGKPARGKWAGYRGDDGQYVCPGEDCGRSFCNPQGFALHTKANPDHLAGSEAA